ncbi:MAG TPA: hypothetical protein VFZ65_09630 [Planctomycetota bacterium]|nr:hypothetical protein [Planctomycetota bacterium]
MRERDDRGAPDDVRRDDGGEPRRESPRHTREPGPGPRPPFEPRRDVPRRDREARPDHGYEDRGPRPFERGEPRREGRRERHSEFPAHSGAPAGRQDAVARERDPHHHGRRDERHGPARGRSEPERPPAQRHEPARTRPTAATATERVAVLVDLDALQADARALNAELTMHRLRAGLGGDRPVVRAVGFVTRAATAPNGFELVVTGADLGGGIQFAATALGLLASAPCLVMAPPSPAIRQLAEVLRGAGHRIELAGFVDKADAGKDVRRLGRDCLFVP